ncbi:hypothetical protein SprV_0301367000 [Sparganum proliferum]
MIVQMIEKDASEDFSSDVQQGDATVVFVQLTVPLSLVEMHNSCVFEILRDLTLTPHLLEERSQVIHELGTSVLVDLSRDCVRSGCFPAGELLHCPDGFLERWRKVEVHVGLHLRQTGDGGVGDGRGAVEDASEVLGPSLQSGGYCRRLTSGVPGGASSRRGEVTTAKEPPPVTTSLRRLDLSTLGQQIVNLSPLLLSDPSTATAATKAATVGGGGRVSSDASAQSSGVGVGANTPLRVNMLNDLIRQMVSLKRTPSSSVSLVGAGNMTATDDGPNNAGVIGSSSRTGSRPTQSAGERKQLELTITSALTRAQRLLDNDAARKALGGTYIYQTDWLSSKPKSDMPFAHVHVDLMGPLSTARGCNYLLTAVDRFARWSFAIPIPNVAADTVPRAFLQHWISHCAVPTTITID